MKPCIWLPIAILLAGAAFLLAALPGRERSSNIVELAGKHFTQPEPISIRPIGDGNGTGIEILVRASSPIAGCQIRSITLDGVGPTNDEELRFGPIQLNGFRSHRYYWLPASAVKGGHEVALRYELIWQDGFCLSNSVRTERLTF